MLPVLPADLKLSASALPFHKPRMKIGLSGAVGVWISGFIIQNPKDGQGPNQDHGNFGNHLPFRYLHCLWMPMGLSSCQPALSAPWLGNGKPSNTDCSTASHPGSRHLVQKGTEPAAIERLLTHRGAARGGACRFKWCWTMLGYRVAASVAQMSWTSPDNVGEFRAFDFI